MNKVILVGRLTQDPEVRYTQSGKAVASFTIAVNRFSGQGQKEADFIPIVAWEKLAEICGNNLTKGQRVLIEGRLQIRSYDANDGQKRRVAEIIAQNMEFLERKQTGDDKTATPFGGQVFPEEEIPF
ncbi:MAG: ssbA [Firmicutes bacterium]|nr:ssbA [Bacillota bacterium]